MRNGADDPLADLSDGPVCWRHDEPRSPGRVAEGTAHGPVTDPASATADPSSGSREGEDRYPPLLTVEQAIRLTQLGRSTVYEALRRGDLPSVRIGRRILIPRRSLMRRLGLDESE